MCLEHFRFFLLAYCLLAASVDLGIVFASAIPAFFHKVGYEDVPFEYDLSLDLCQEEDFDCRQLGCEFEKPCLREASVRIYYPTDHREANEPDDSKDRGFCESDSLSRFDVRFMCDRDVKRVTATSGANVSMENDGYAVVLFSSGLGMVPYMYTTLIQEMVRRGIVVAAISHPFVDKIVQAEGKEFLQKREALNLYQMILLEVSDAHAALDKLSEMNGDDAGRFYHRFDLENGVGYMGHSLGGATAMLAAIEERKIGNNRVRAVLNMDGIFLHGGRNFAKELRTPLMVMGTPRIWSLFFKRQGASWESIAEGSVAFYVKKSGHYSFSDICHEMNFWERAAEILNSQCGPVSHPILPNEMDEVVVEYAFAFFQLHLNNDGTLRDVLKRPHDKFGDYYYK